MGGAETTGAPVRSPLPDVSRALPGVAAGASVKISGGGSRGRGRYVGSRKEGYMDQGKEIGWWGGAGSEKWEMVVELVQTLVWDGALAEESTWIN